MNSNTAKTALGIAMIVAVVCTISFLLYLAFRESQEPGFDSTTLCPEAGAIGHLAVLLDTTDPISISQLQAARQIIEKKIEEVDVGTRVSFSTVSPESDVRKSAFYSICKPPTGEEASYFTENPRLIREKYETDFLNPVQVSLNQLLTIGESTSSPIMEALQEFITSIPGFITDDKPRELIVMSDLIQHTDAYSFYRGLSWDMFKSSGGVSRLSKNLGGATITVLRVPSSVRSVEVVDDFWVRYFDAQGFSRVNVFVVGDL